MRKSGKTTRANISTGEIDKETVRYFDLLMVATSVMLLVLVNFAFNANNINHVGNKIKDLKAEIVDLESASITEKEKIKLATTLAFLKNRSPSSTSEMLNSVLKIVQYIGNEEKKISQYKDKNPAQQDANTGDPDQQQGFINAMGLLNKNFGGNFLKFSETPLPPSEFSEFKNALGIVEVQFPEVVQRQSAKKLELSDAAQILHQFLNFRTSLFEHISKNILPILIKSLDTEIMENEINRIQDYDLINADIREIERLMTTETDTNTIKEIEIATDKQQITAYREQLSDFKDKMDGKIKILDVETPIILIIPVVPIVCVPFYALFLVHLRLQARKGSSSSSSFLLNKDRPSMILTMLALAFPVILVILFYVFKYSVFSEILRVQEGFRNSIILSRPFKTFENGVQASFTGVVDTLNLLSTIGIFVLFPLGCSYRIRLTKTHSS